MRVKINGEVYDSKETPIILHLTSTEKKCIGNMPEDLQFFCAYATETDETPESIRYLMKQFKDEEAE
jgi:hypothetical protein